MGKLLDKFDNLQNGINSKIDSATDKLYEKSSGLRSLKNKLKLKN